MKPEALRVPEPTRLSMHQAIVAARNALGAVTSLAIDAVGRCERQANGAWQVKIDVIEAMARMGDNDLLTTFEVELDGEGEPLRIERLGRYRREDRDQP